MSSQSPPDSSTEGYSNRGRVLIWATGLWAAPLVWILSVVLPASPGRLFEVVAAGCLLAPVPALLILNAHQKRLLRRVLAAREETAKLQLQIESMRYRTSRLREELADADRQARLSHQLTVLGRFTAGFMHEFNNPLAIVSNRIEILLEERKDDAELRADLEQMLKETHYMGSIAKTLLQALRRERGGEAFAPAIASDCLAEACTALSPAAEKQAVRIEVETSEVPPVDVPRHVLNQVVRGLVNNSLEALKGRQDGVIWLRLEPYRTAGAQVVLRVEDNGTGVADEIREHLFEPFTSGGTSRERVGLGLFLAASLLDTYDGRLSYQPREGGGAAFTIELPPARFARGQGHHWFVKGDLS